MTCTAVPRLYDVTTDTFITDRAKIIDAVVTRFAHLATWSERLSADEPSGQVSVLAENFLRGILAGRPEYPVCWVVADLWRGMVTR